MSHYAAESPSTTDAHRIAEAATAAPTPAGWMPRNAEALRRALVARRHELQAAWQRIDELQGRDSLLEQKVALLEREVAMAHRFAYHDELTGLPNRRLLLDRFNQVVARGIRQHQQVAVLFIDLDGFKRLNDVFGHAVGDSVLEQAGKRLTGCIRASDTACRYGGDEFVVLLPEVQDRAQAVAVAAKIHAQLGVPYAVGDSTITNTASIGMAIFPVDGCELRDLIKASDRDMYRNKARRPAPPSVPERGADAHDWSPEVARAANQVPPLRLETAGMFRV
jgi:diguanylate cyclase